jgi:hypothetical protein
MADMTPLERLKAWVNQCPGYRTAKITLYGTITAVRMEDIQDPNLEACSSDEDLDAAVAAALAQAEGVQRGA